jgi:hypothetical protein
MGHWMLSSMGRPIQILAVFLLLTLASVVRAQTPVTCGVGDVEGPSEVDAGTPLRFKAKISGMNHITKPEFKWYLSLGTIMTGEGTDEITVDTVGLGGMVLTVTAGLSGVPPGCKGAASRTTAVRPQAIGCCHVFDRYGDIDFDDEKARLDNFAIQLSDLPLSSGYILMAAGQETFEKEAAEHLARAKSYLVDVRKIDKNRIVTVDCGFSQELAIHLYILPPGVLPVCGDSEVPFSEVKFTKPRPKSSKKQH